MTLGLDERPEVVSDLDALGGSDLERAAAALDRLWSRTLPRVMRQLTRCNVAGDEAEDIAQEVQIRIWRYREGLRARTAGEWYVYVRRTVFNELSRYVGSRSRETVLGEFEDVPNEDMPTLDVLVAEADRRHSLYELADRLWLGQTGPRTDIDLGAVVVQLVVLDGLEPSLVALQFGVDERTIEDWLADPVVLLRAAFSALCWSNDALAGHVLRPERPLTTAELDGLARGEFEAIPPCAWSDEEAQIVVWRVRYGMQPDAIERASQRFERKAIEELLDRIRDAFPFRQIAVALRDALVERDGEERIAQPGLWKRIVLEYHARHDLPHRHIVERAGPPADEARFRLNDTTLNNWLSMGRIYNELAAHVEEAWR